MAQWLRKRAWYASRSNRNTSSRRARYRSRWFASSASRFLARQSRTAARWHSLHHELSW